jgi:hypothetical protein
LVISREVMPERVIAVRGDERVVLHVACDSQVIQ